MKLRYFVIGLIFALAAPMAKAQVFEMYYQGFETTETVHFSASSPDAVTYDSQLHASGDRSLKLLQSTSDVIYIVSDTIDFTQNATLHYIALEFDHITNTPPNGTSPVCKIYAKKTVDADWTPLNSQHYNTANNNGGSMEFISTAMFCRESYPDWSSPITNDSWKSERFDLDQFIGSGVPINERKLLIKYEVRSKSNRPAGSGWWLDNVRVRASQNQMVTPKIVMRCYPDGGAHPSSRGARITLDARTTVPQGIQADSVYITYTVGSDPTHKRVTMTPQGSYVGHDNVTYWRFTGRIPFEGYDTTMRFFCTVKDATTNFNDVTFPEMANSWIEYHCVRGSAMQPGAFVPGFSGTTTTTNTFPFPPRADARSEWVYDSALMAEAGYGPGSIVAMRYSNMASAGLSARPKFQIRMKNIPTSYTQNPDGERADFTPVDAYMHAVYDSMLVIEAGSGVDNTINLQDTFFYAGKDILVQMIYDGTSDVSAVSVRTIPAPQNKKSLLFFTGAANSAYNAYVSTEMKRSDAVSSVRPVFIMTETANMPLVYDMGVSEIAFPNESNPIINQPSYIDVKLKNYGEATVNGIAITYTIDDTITGSYEWTGALAGGAETTVRVATGVTLPAGYHFIRSWVEDTMVVGAQRLRDHEPLNDTSYSEFIVCAGPLNGVRYVGGPNADYNTINEFLFSLSQCGVNDSLIVRVAEGEYPPFVVPEFDGATAQHYVVLEPVVGATVTIKADGVASDMANMENTPYFRLRGLTFVRATGALSNMVLLGQASTGCRIENCTFIDSIENPTSSMRISSVINTGFANNLIISGNTIIGGDVGINLVGQASDIRSNHNRVLRNVTYNQYSTGIAVTNQSNVLVEKNEMYDALSNSNYVLRIMNCYDTVKILSNKVYTSHGAQAVGVNHMNGTSALHALIANNMVVCADDGLANLQNTPFNIIAGQWIDVVFNSVKMTAPTRNNVATATFGGGVLSNSRFFNNIVACYDNFNYAFSFMPGNQVTNTVGHNIYYSEGSVLNRRSGTSYVNLDAWHTVMPDDTNSVSINPMFLNGSLVDLRTFNRLVKGVGIPIPTVATDMFDTLRSATAPCAGAFEFTSLYHDYEVETLFNPSSDNCNMPNQVELVIGIRNSGIFSYTPGGSVSLSGAYSINGSTPHPFAINRAVPAEDTMVYNTGQMVQLPPHGIYDSVYNIKIWTICSSDPNKTNDTNTFRVISRYHAVAPDSVTRMVPYNTSDSIVISSGISQWALYNATGSPTMPSTIYWYYSPEDTEPFQSGTTYVTDILRQDTHFYVRQQREVPIVRITQVQLFSADTVVGLTDPMPEWIHANAKVVVQLTNVGDDTAYIENDSLLFVSPTNSYNNKFYKFPAGVTIAPGKSLAVQFTTSSMANQLPYMLRANVAYAPLHTTDFGLVYRDGGVKDAVAFNNEVTDTRWTNLNVPSYVWSGNGLPLANNIYAGVVRQAFNGNSGDWLYATEDAPMHLASTDLSWLRYTANRCEGDVGVVTVQMIQPPAVDLELEPMPVHEGCNLGNETISVRVHNFGIGPANNVQLNYAARGYTVTETLTSPIPAASDTVYSFVTPLNMIVDVDTLVDIVIWATAMSGDPLSSNDTCRTTALASHTPAMPVFMDTVHIDYATSDTLTLATDSLHVPVWYDYDGNAVDTSNVYITDILYSNGVMGVGLLYHKDSTIHIGTLASLSTKNAYPSPYQPKSAQAKQQFIYTAHELRAMGLLPGAISAIEFHLDSIHKVNNTTQRDSIVFNNFDIYLGTTTDTIFANTTAWKTAQMVYSHTNMTIYRSQSHGWVMHQLDTPFMWDGEHGIVVQVVTNISPVISTGVQTAYTAKANTVLTKDGASVGAGYTAAGTKGGNRPDIRFIGKVNGCQSPIKHFNITLDGIPEKDATVYMPAGSDTSVYNSCGNINMQVVVRNMGRDTINGYQLHYSIDGGQMDTTFVANVVPGGAEDQVQLFSRHLMPGHHNVLAVVSVVDDSVYGNDTVRTSFNVRFCAGNYTIGAGSTYDYHSFGEAIDSLEVAGIDGPVVFMVAGGIYNEQVVLGEIEGSSPQNKITFRGSSDSVALVKAVNTAQANYVVNIDGLSNIEFDNLQMVSRPAGSANTAHVMVLQNTGNVTVRNSVLRVKGSVHHQNGSCIMLQGNVRKLQLVSNVLDSGYYSLSFANNTNGYEDFSIQGNTCTNFNLASINLKGLKGLNINKNVIRSEYRGKLTGIILENIDSIIRVQKNKIYLLGALTGANSVIDGFGKRGVELKSVSGNNQQCALVTNNMISASSNGVSGQDPVGIFIDGTSSYINVYYNTVRVYAGASDVTKSKALFTGAQTSHLQIMNNILSNFSGAYAYYITSSNNITSSDYNDYYAAGEKFAYWGGADRADLSELQVAGTRDGSSLDEEPYFVANDDLHLSMTNFVSKGQYNTDVIDDIDDEIRSQMPSPTLGADEMRRLNHNMSVVRIISPTIPVDTTFPGDAMPPNIEGDSVLVKAVFYNNGNSTETNIRWHAYVIGHEGVTTSVVRNLGTFYIGQLKIDSVWVPTTLGIIGVQTIMVEFVDFVDDSIPDNSMQQDFYLAPAYNLEAVRMTVPSGCSLQHSPIAITVKNAGFKEFPAGTSFEIGYHAQGYHPTIQSNLNANKLNIATMPDTVREIHTFASSLPRNSSRDFTFDSLANLYPTDTALNIKVRVNGWCHYQYDVSPSNDSTKTASSFSPQVDSWYTPNAPVGHDTSFAYGTWGEVTAEQHSDHAPSNLAGRPIKWHRDSTAAQFYGPNNYNNSCKWSTTPQYFHDSTYYLQCFSDKNCPSAFSEVHVTVRPRVPVDVGLDNQSILAPLGSRVYMENDTVRVMVHNYGTYPQSNIPMVYQVRKGNNTNPIQTVHDTIRASIPAGQSYAFTFNTLINFNLATQAGSYQLRVWTDMPDDTIRRNDTIRCVEQLRPTAANNTSLDYPFVTRGDSYSYKANANDNSYDFIRLAFNEIDIDLPPLGRLSTNFGAFNNPEYPVLHVTRGTVDSLITIVVKSDDPNMRSRAKFAAYIDFNRSGNFEDDPVEKVVSSQQINTNERVANAITIPYSASYGYMRMRVVLSNYEDEPTSTLTNSAGADIAGHMVDFLLFVDPEPPTVDLAFTQIVAPRDMLLRTDDSLAVSFRVANKGSQPLTHFDVHYQYDADTIDSTCVGTFQWNGVLMPGASDILSLPMHHFTIGTSRLRIWHELAGDTVATNNTLQYEYHRFHTITLRMNENFDSLDLWYAPVGYNNYTKNYWQRGTPMKSNIQGAFSEPNAWVTDTMSVITSGRRGNVSYLYSPIIDISQIKADTLSIRLLRNLIGGSYLRLEFYNFERQWENVFHDSILANWYNDVDAQGFTGTSAGGAYNRYWAPSDKYLAGDYNEKLQFRFVYVTPQGANDAASFGDGCAIDDFYIGRARRGKDIGVIDIIEPVNPKYGQTVYPKVIVKNYGLDTIKSMQLGYIHYGTNIPKLTSFPAIAIPPGMTDTFLFDSPCIITSDFPDTFSISAFTILSADIYDDNDTCDHSFFLAPLDNDISAEEFIAPLDRVIAGDSTVVVTMRVRNFGQNPIPGATLTYIVNDDYSVTESVDFNEVLGRPLQSTENFNYTFRQHFQAAMGVMRIVGIVKCDSNEYIYNDTINKRITGISSITDMAARSIVVDTARRDAITVTLIMENLGARGANGFEVGFWIDNDTSTIFRSTYSSALPIPALSGGYLKFDTTLVGRSAPYAYVTAYVNVPDDNDRTNDTTSLLVGKYVDLEAVEVVVEENAGPDCNVYFRLRNNGNTAFDRTLSNVRVTVNGNDLTVTLQPRVEPMQTTLMALNRTIPKDPQRHYVGSGSFVYALDSVQTNNQTNVVRVVNYVEGVPEVGAGQLVLDQNYPNPFSRQTTIPFTLPNAAEVRYFVMDALGHIVISDHAFFMAGSNSIVLDMDRFATGVYYYGIEVDGQRQMRKMVLR